MKTMISAFLLILAGCSAHPVDLQLGATTDAETLKCCPGSRPDDSEVEGLSVLRWEVGSSWIRLTFDNEGRLFGANMFLIAGDLFPFTVQGIGPGTTATELRTRFGPPKIELDDGGPWSMAEFAITYSSSPDTLGILIGPPF